MSRLQISYTQNQIYKTPSKSTPKTFSENSQNNKVFYSFSNLKAFVHKWTGIGAPVDHKNIYKKDEGEYVDLGQSMNGNIWTEDRRKLSKFGYDFLSKE